MFGADTPLVFEALQLATLTAAAGVGAAMLWKRKRRSQRRPETRRSPGELEERVEVLERIATDRTKDLADEIEALRDSNARVTQLENTEQ